eukprot:scaffold73682_cov14-Tisochrysis_lutea.AAC.1
MEKAGCPQCPVAHYQALKKLRLLLRLNCPHLCLALHSLVWLGPPPPPPPPPPAESAETCGRGLCCTRECFSSDLWCEGGAQL